jgi:hypothetical protein
MFMSLVAMGSFYKLCIKTNLATLHYVTFIKSFGVFPTEVLSFDSKQLMNNCIKEFESKNNDLFLHLEEHFFTIGLVYKKITKFNSKICRMKFLSSSHKYKNSGKICFA